jgi:hypothetical protein
MRLPQLFDDCIQGAIEQGHFLKQDGRTTAQFDGERGDGFVAHLEATPIHEQVA